ncbi:MAG: hypothetical protein IAF38_10555 [Bacteroidia bacterium]|nr:hypothetical protein [Bacteroidia bacterium]
MAIYRFRVTFEEYDEVYRDIEIRSSQTFKDFHIAIQEAIKFDNKHAASFFVSDDYWRKGLEITLLKEDLEDGVKLMESTKIVSCVEDPHQHFVYVYDKAAVWSFNIGLIKIIKDEPKGILPSCVKTMGTPPKQYKTDALIKDENLAPEVAMAGLLKDLDDEEAYKVAIEKPEEILDQEEAKSVGDEDAGAEEGFEEEEGEGDEEGFDAPPEGF